jgi:hypothetical protein
MSRGSGQTVQKNAPAKTGWLLFFYRVPSRPVSSRMKIWRKLMKAGSVQLKGAVYVLPNDDEHYEFFQWLVAEVASMGGEAGFTRVDAIDSMKDGEIVSLFNRRKEEEYPAIVKGLDDLETKLNSMSKGSGPQNLKALAAQFARVSRIYADARKTDFFASKAGTAMQSRIAVLGSAIKVLAGATKQSPPLLIPPRKPEDFQGKIWISRKRPFVDRMASAWLIRRFIDRNATFTLGEEKDLSIAGSNRIAFDVNGGMFTHVGDLCTFEVLLKAFGLKDKTLKKIAEIVHELDVKDEKYRNVEAAGLEEILSGIRKTAKNDNEALEKGISVFEMLYSAKSS